MRQNLSSVIRQTKSSGARALLCGMKALPLYGWSYTLDFHDAFVALAREHDVPLVPFFMASVVGRDELLNLALPRGCGQVHGGLSSRARGASGFPSM